MRNPPQTNPFKVGDKVKRDLPWDGTRRAGFSVGRGIRITKIEDKFYHGDVLQAKDGIVWLADGKWELWWNLTEA